MTTTLKEYAENKLSLYQGLRSAAQSDLTDAVQALQDAQAIYDDAVSDYADLEKDASAKRGQIAVAAMPSDIEVLAEALRVVNLALRDKRVQITAAEAALSEAGVQRDEAEARLKHAIAQVREADAALERAKTRQAAHDAWKAVVDGDALADLATQATGLLAAVEGAVADPCAGLDGLAEPADDDELIVAARLRVECDIPSLLRTRARERVVLSRGNDVLADVLVTLAEDELDKHDASDGGASGTTAKQRRAFLRAESLYSDFVLRAQERYDEAIALLQSVWDSAPLTEAQKARIEDTDLATDGAAARAKESERDEKKALVDATLIAIEQAEILALVNDVDADPTADATVSDFSDDLVDLKDDLAAAEAAYTAEMRDDLDRWDGAVPDPIWANLLAYDRALDLLTVLKDTDPSALASAMEAAEDGLVTALASEDKGRRLSNALGGRIELYMTRKAFLGNTREQRTLAAARGDQ